MKQKRSNQLVSEHVNQEPESFFDAFERLTRHFSPRSKEIISDRFGIGKNKQKTLEDIGQGYGITRERVRQIIRAALKDIQLKHETVAYRSIAQKIETVLKKRNGVVKEVDILAELGGDSAHEKGSVRLFLESLSFIHLMKEDDLVYRSWVSHEFSFDEWKKINDLLKKFLKDQNIPFDEDTLKEQCMHLFDSEDSHSKLFHYLSVSKEVEKNVFGKWGLSAWSDINPKGTREKAYLILKVFKKPFHFREIADLIDKHGLQKSKSKKTHPQTVHNELIKDSRFVLIGRGIYALSEWGYQRGTIRDVIKDILVKNGEPMEREDIIKEVLKLRHVKKTTIVINLNTFFAKVGKSAYTIKK